MEKLLSSKPSPSLNLLFAASRNTPLIPQLSLYLQQALKSYPRPPPALIPPPPAHPQPSWHQMAIKEPSETKGRGPGSPLGKLGQTLSCTPSCRRAPDPL